MATEKEAPEIKTPATRTPKETFLASPLRSDYEKIALSDAFNVALDYALLEMLMHQPSNATAQAGWDAHSRMVGARELARQLRTFYLPDTAGSGRMFPNLKSPK